MAIVLWLVPAAALGQERAAAWVTVYQDDDGLRVISPQTVVQADVAAAVEIEAGYDVDIISAATVDVVTAASPRGYSEERHGFLVGAAVELEPGTVIRARYLPTWEPDYRSHGVFAGASRELWERRITAAIGAQLSLDRVGRSGDDPSRWRDLRTLAVQANLGLVLDHRTVLSTALETQVVDGFQASPYRYVDVTWPDATVRVPEAVPGGRIRVALAAGVRRELGDRWFLSGNLRAYRDTWAVSSLTGSAALERAFGWDRLVLGAAVRGYLQDAASFYRGRYEASSGVLPEWRSADRMLAPSWSVLAGFRAEAATGPVLGLDAIRGVLKLEVYDQRFRDFAPLEGRRALVASFGAQAEW